MRRPIEDRFWERVDRRGDDECWPWRGATPHGYGTIWVDTKVGIPAHRFAYELLVGPIPGGMTVDHLCHGADDSCAGGDSCPHRRCCNPAHLEPVTRAENVLRGRSPVALLARATHCVHGHPFDAANTYYRRDRNGRRECITCRRERDQNRRRS